MTARLLLIRHASHDELGRALTGRNKGVRLGPTGRAQAWRLGEALADRKIAAVYTSPRERTRETAAAIASTCESGPVLIANEIDEIDFGEWSGKTFEELSGDAQWHRWNELREEAVTPAGESMADVQARAVGCLERMARKHRNETVAAVSHADVIKAVVCGILDMSVSRCFHFDIDPASVTTIDMGDWGAKLIRLNEIA